jgi:hypothetical protein
MHLAGPEEQLETNPRFSGSSLFQTSSSSSLSSSLLVKACLELSIICWPTTAARSTHGVSPRANLHWQDHPVIFRQIHQSLNFVPSLSQHFMVNLLRLILMLISHHWHIRCSIINHTIMYILLAATARRLILTPEIPLINSAYFFRICN